MRATVEYLLHTKLGRAEMYKIHPRQVDHPLVLRRDSSDIDVFREIFLDGDYFPLDNMTNVSLIVDCGANVGYLSAWFLSRYPDCQIIAVEPDPDNFTILQYNLAAYGDRANAVHASVWSHKVQLMMSQQFSRDGCEGTKQVRVCGPGEKAEFEGLDMGSLLAASGYDRISLLKMDIEGAEAVVFSENYESWLDRVDTITIELHDDSSFGNASEVFFSAISGRGFQISRCRELIICHRFI
jgi:FkbM family methyltransferase